DRGDQRTGRAGSGHFLDDDGGCERIRTCTPVFDRNVRRVKVAGPQRVVGRLGELGPLVGGCRVRCDLGGAQVTDRGTDRVVLLGQLVNIEVGHRELLDRSVTSAGKVGIRWRGYSRVTSPRGAGPTH